jgi:broad specificity phosphatase PhoE
MQGINLWLIRHGETEINSGNWSVKPAETCLTALGREQALKLSAKVIVQPDLLIISPLLRAQETAQFIQNQWPDAPSLTWPIQELIYLSPERLSVLDQSTRREEVRRYWQKNDPNYCDGEGAESFASFLQRVNDFHAQILKQQGFIVAIGHGQFFKAFQLGLIHGFRASSAWMNLFRQEELANPIKNGEIVQINLN